MAGDEMTEYPAEIVKDRYRLVLPLTRTPVGIVYRGEDLGNGNRAVLIKELLASPSSGISEKEIEERFERETRVLSAVRHEGFPELIDSFVHRDHYFIVEAFLDGETIDSLSMKRSVPFPVRLVLKWALKLCDIIAVLHGNRPEPIIFRDITPSNIIVVSEEDVRLADFGISRYFNPLKVKDTFAMGTPGFSPPEQYGKGQSDERSDIYSLGATLFYCLTLHQIEEFAKKRPSLCQLNPLIDRSLDRAILRCLEKGPENRYQSIGELRQALEGCSR
jgi:serine/threonine-protein kinase